MPLCRPARLLCALCLAFMLPCLAALADGGGPPRVEGPVPPFKRHEQKEDREERIYVRLAYPEFGIPVVDAAVRAELADFTEGLNPAALLESRLAFLRETYEHEAVWLMEQSFGYNLYAPRAGILSIEFSTWFVEQGMPHGESVQWARTFDLRSGKELCLRDVFPDWDASAPKLEALLAEFLRDVWGDPDVTYLERRLAAIAPEDRSFLLAPDGLTILHSGLPISMWGMGAIHADLDGMEEAGLDTRLWR